MSHIDQILLAMSQNPLLWGMYYFPHHFRKPSPPFHLKILKEALTNLRLAVAAPRESAKSTILAFLYPFHCICFNKKHFIVIVSNTYKKSCTSLDNIKKELRENEKLKRDFPIIITKDAEGDSIFKHPDGTEIRVLCKGAEQIGAVRGEKFGAFRPDLIIVDDVEDDELVRNPERRIILQELYDQALIPAGEQGIVQVLVIGTILHDDSQMSKLVSTRYYPEYRKLLYRAKNEKNSQEFSLWEDKWTLTDLKKLEVDKPDVFAKEYQNDPVSGSQAKFHKEDFRYWKIENLQYVLFDDKGNIVGKGKLSDCKGAIACDLAWEEGRQNDYSVILPAFLTPQSDILIDTYICKKGLREDEMWEMLTTMESRLKALTGVPIPIGFEKAKLEKVMKHLLKKEMRKYNKFLWFKDLMWDSDKITRIETRLQARYAQHVIYHKQGMGELERQLTRFPSGVHDDLPDAEQGVVQLLSYPKTISSPQGKETEFEWIRRKTIEARNPSKKRYVYGSKHKPFGIPAEESYR